MLSASSFLMQFDPFRKSSLLEKILVIQVVTKALRVVSTRKNVTSFFNARKGNKGSFLEAVEVR